MRTIRAPIDTVVRYRFECSNWMCKAVLEAEHKEVTIDRAYAWISCPYCKTTIVLKASELDDARVE